jgi:hypothetical protein
MIADMQKHLDTYVGWLRDKTQLRAVDDWVEITTPFLDRHNDYIQIYARKVNGGYVLTDDGYTISDLAQSGCNLDSQKRQQLLKMTLNGFGVKLHDEALEVQASPENFALRKHNLVQAMLAVNDMFYLAGPVVSSFFYEDVSTWLDLNDVRYTPHVKLTGSSGFDHHFDFVIPKSRKQPERILKTINRPGRDTAESVAFSWIDTKDVRSANSRIYALLNDTDMNVSSSVMDALKSYDVHPVAWSRRDEVVAELVE